jgi:hypothetical protein
MRFTNVEPPISITTWRRDDNLIYEKIAADPGQNS